MLGASVLIIPPSHEAVIRFGSVDAATQWVAWGRALAFLMGSLFSYTVGYVGMNVAVDGNVRVAAAARLGYNPALQVAYRSGSVTGMLTVGLGLLGGTIIFLVFGISAPDALLGYGFGGSLIALFMSVKSKQVFPKTTHAMPPSSPTWSVTMSVTVPAWPPMCSKASR